MNYNDHEPPHFHARYQEFEVVVEIETSVVRGAMPRRMLGLIFAWMDRNQAALLRNWQLARERKPLEPIPPL
jgi:hypothetical protein